MKKKICILFAVMCVFANTALAVNFTDINNHWAKDSIITLAQKGVVNGITDTEFVPDGEVTRAQYLKMIMEATGIETTAVRTGECLDADGDDWYGTYLQSALDKGLIPKDMVTGYSESVDYKVDGDGNATYTKVIYKGAFNGNLPIKREEMAVLTQYMYQYTRTILTNKRTETKQPSAFRDNDSISDWAKVSVNQAVANGFMDGMDDNMFNPAFTATRAQAATVILRVLNK